MEKKVLAWLDQTQLMQRFRSHIEIDAQYPIGEYLRQLDPTYQHPNYKVDFLVKIRGKDKTISIIIEYDGFKEHFTVLDEIDASNYGLYMKPQDVERQKVLESYGYRFLRLNRFNLGKDPVRTLDERLSRMVQEALQAAKPHAPVEIKQPCGAPGAFGRAETAADGWKLIGSARTQDAQPTCLCLASSS